MPAQDISFVVLAGGKSRRMGTNKVEMKYLNKTFLENQIEKGRALGIEEIFVSGYESTECDVQTVPDNLKERGPLSGIEACLRKCTKEYALIVGIDLPKIRVKDLEAMMQQVEKSGSKITILEHKGKEEPLIGIYHRSLADEIYRALQNGKGSVFAFINKTGYEVYVTDSPDTDFININDDEAYQKLLLETQENSLFNGEYNNHKKKAITGKEYPHLEKIIVEV